MVAAEPLANHRGRAGLFLFKFRGQGQLYLLGHARDDPAKQD